MDSGRCLREILRVMWEGRIVYRQIRGMPMLQSARQPLSTYIARLLNNSRAFFVGGCDVGSEANPFHQLNLKVYQLGIHGTQLGDVRRIPVRLPLVRHEPRLRDGTYQCAAEEAERRASRCAHPPLKCLAGIIEVGLVSQPDRVVIPLLSA